MVNYKNSKIYKIICNTTGDVYFGSTTQKNLANRMTTHRKKDSNLLSQIIISRQNYSYCLVERYECDNSEDLYQRLRYYIDNFDCINKQLTSSNTHNTYVKKINNTTQEQIDAVNDIQENLQSNNNNLPHHNTSYDYHTPSNNKTNNNTNNNIKSIIKKQHQSIRKITKKNITKQPKQISFASTQTQPESEPQPQPQKKIQPESEPQSQHNKVLIKPEPQPQQKIQLHSEPQQKIQLHSEPQQNYNTYSIKINNNTNTQTIKKNTKPPSHNKTIKMTDYVMLQ